MERQRTLLALKQATPFDLLIVGGGATGCGICLDAASRGLKVALVERMDIAEGTSCRSTKLAHGGVRYLEKAIKHLNRAQYNLVKEGLHERGLLLKNAPHLSNRISFVTPLYQWLDVPQVFIGLKLYDLLSGKMCIGHSRLLSRRQTLKRFPMIKAEGLKAGVLYYDGQFNDARMAVSIARTAEQQGAIIGNHIEVVALSKEDGKVRGAVVRDNLSGDEWTIRAKGVINATGPFADRLRQLDDPTTEPIMTVSSGIHIVLDKRFAPPENGLMIPKTDDGRVLFILPWQGHALVGTTDDPAQITDHPAASDKEIDYLLRHIGHYFDLQPTRGDIKATWSGLRPLVADPAAADTSNLVRDHVISLSTAELLSIVGGKWTSYRRMAEDTLDQALNIWNLGPASPCKTTQLPIIGGDDYQVNGDQALANKYQLAADISYNLHRAYGDQAEQVAELSKKDLAKRLHPQHPFIEAEVLYAIQHEFSLRAIDFLTRRIPLALIDNSAAREVLPRVVELMAKKLNWDQQRCTDELELANQRLHVAL